MLLLRLLTPDGARCDMFCSQSTMLVGLPIHCTSFYIPVKCMLSVLGYQPLSFTGFQVITASSTNSVFGHHRQLSIYVHHQHFATYHASSRDGPFTLLNDYLRCYCLHTCYPIHCWFDHALIPGHINKFRQNIQPT